MAKDRQRGELLVSVMIRSTKWMILIWSAIAAYLVIAVVVLLWKRQAHVLSFLGAAGPLLTYGLYPRARFFEGGVEIPPTENVNRRRFLRWDQIDRYSWDANKLILSGTTSILSGGPVEGDILAIPASKRDQVDQIVAMRTVTPQP